MQADKSKMTEMFSQQAEKVPFERPVEVKGVPRPVPALSERVQPHACIMEVAFMVWC